MKPSTLLADLITSATGAKTHFDIWWAQVSDAKPAFVSVMNTHSDFFLASQDAHYKAFFINLAHLFDKRSDSSSLPTYLNAIRTKTDPTRLLDLETRYAVLATRADPLVTVRHKTVAHIDARLTEKDVFAPLNITWNEIRSVINDTGAFVTELAGAAHSGEIGIPRDGRLAEATLRLLLALQPRVALVQADNH